jgi:hypothetical protein
MTPAPKTQRIRDQISELEAAINRMTARPETLQPGEVEELRTRVAALKAEVEPIPKKRHPSKAQWKKALGASLAGTLSAEDREILDSYQEAPWARKDARLAALYKTYHPSEGMESAKQELLYIAQVLVLCGLPYRQPKGTNGAPLTHWERSARTAQGEVRLTLGTMDPKVGLPYGKDRVLLSWLITKALQTGSPKITWETATEFFEAFGLDTGGATYRWFLAAWKRLANLAIKIDRHEYGGGEDWGRLRVVIEDYRLPTLKEQQQEAAGGVRLPLEAPYAAELGAKLFQELQEGRVVPLPLPVMREFQDEPKAWDFACFVFWRSWVCQKAQLFNANPVARVSWQDLQLQLGSTDKDAKQLRKTLRTFLDRLRLVWPECQAGFDGSTLVVEPPRSSLHLVQAKD